MKITEDKKGDINIMHIEGEINLNTSPELRRVFDNAIKNNTTKLVIDFSSVPYVDSSGLATLIELFQRLKRTNGKLRIYNVQDKVRSVFEITKLHKLFEIHESLDSALEDF